MTETKSPPWLIIWGLVLIAVPYRLDGLPLVQMIGVVILTAGAWRLYRQRRCSLLAPVAAFLHWLPHLLALVFVLVPYEMPSHHANLMVGLAMALASLLLQAVLCMALLSGLITVREQQGNPAEARRLRTRRAICLLMLLASPVMASLPLPALLIPGQTEAFLPVIEQLAGAAVYAQFLQRCAIWLVAWTYYQSTDVQESATTDAGEAA